MNEKNGTQQAFGSMEGDVETWIVPFVYASRCASVKVKC